MTSRSRQSWMGAPMAVARPAGWHCTPFTCSHPTCPLLPAECGRGGHRPSDLPRPHGSRHPPLSGADPAAPWSCSNGLTATAMTGSLLPAQETACKHDTSLTCLCCCPAPIVRPLNQVPAALQTDVVPVGNDQASAADCHAVAGPSCSYSLSKCLEHAACCATRPVHPDLGNKAVALRSLTVQVCLLAITAALAWL